VKLLSLFVALVLSSSVWAADEPKAQLSPAEQKIRAAELAIKKNPNQCEPYTNLAMALARRARETSDATYYAKAEEALEHALKSAPDNFEARKTEVWILLGRHEFAKALKEAEALNRRAPDDVQVYGFVTDANVELGHYAEAEKAAQWMLDIRPGNLPGLTRAAYLRELMGDLDGAAELMNEAYQETPINEAEDRAWILTQLAHLQLVEGRVGDAAKLLDEALQLYPGYHYALENLAKIRIAQKKYVEAVELLRRRNQRSAQPESLYALGEALELAGQGDEARAAYADFVEKARRQMEIADNANRELVFYYADHADDAAEALRIARLEAGRRQDCFTLDAYAWALFANGQFAEAEAEIQKALAYGTRDARFFYHAGAIALKLNDRGAAVRFLKQSLDLNPVAECSSAARRSLTALTNPAVAPPRSSARHVPRV